MSLPYLLLFLALTRAQNAAEPVPVVAEGKSTPPSSLPEADLANVLYLLKENPLMMMLNSLAGDHRPDYG